MNWSVISLLHCGCNFPLNIPLPILPIMGTSATLQFTRNVFLWGKMNQDHMCKLRKITLLSGGTHSSVVGWGNILQAGRSRVWFLMRLLDFSIDLILPVELWPWGWFNL
jgi:hypothetical protein